MHCSSGFWQPGARCLIPAPDDLTQRARSVVPKSLRRRRYGEPVRSVISVTRLSEVQGDRGVQSWAWWFNYHRLLGPIGHVPPVE